MGPRKGKCKTCQWEIYWATTGLGKPAPFDAQPNHEGGWWLTHNPTSGQNTAHVAPKGAQPRRNRYVSHFSTCPHANEHRK